MGEWKRDYAVLREGDERYKRHAGRVMLLIVERDFENRELWEGRTHDSTHSHVLLKRKFATKEEAMRAIEKKAFRMLQEALEDINPKAVSYISD